VGNCKKPELGDAGVGLLMLEKIKSIIQRSLEQQRSWGITTSWHQQRIRIKGD